MKNKYESCLKAFIDLTAFKNNINLIRKKFPESKIILPVKANAYGHGDIIISKEAENLGIEYLAVARTNEGINLRNSNIKLPIMNLGVEIGDNIQLAVNNRIELSVSSYENIKEIEKISRKKNQIIPIHLKLDTGMSRLGSNFIECEKIARFIIASKNLKLKSIYTHFAKSENDKKLTRLQTDLFFNFKAKLDSLKIHAEFYHLFNSGAILNPPDYPIINNFYIRPGILSYGYTSDKKNESTDFMPVMTLVTKVLNIKDVNKGTGVSYGHTFKTNKRTKLATIALGYGDGFSRSLSNKFMVTINNKNYSQRGTISMDLTVVEVDDQVKMGDEVFIFGNKKICVNDAKDLAGKINTISYEITTSLTNRVERVPTEN